MKKALLLVVLSLLLFTSLKPTMANTSDVPYSGYAERSDYDRIEKVDGVWYGVLTIDDYVLLPPVSGPMFARNEIYLRFTREVDAVIDITYEYKQKDKCLGVYILGTCIGVKTTYEYETEQVFNKFEDGSLRELLALTQDNIQKLDDDFTLYMNNEHYDFLIKTETSQPIGDIKIIQFTLVLTDEEVSQLRLDIQDQYEQEYREIINNSFLTSTEKQSLINSLNAEYSEYEIDFGEEMNVPCVGDECEYTVPEEETLLDRLIREFLENLDGRLANYAKYFVIAVIATIIASLTAYQLAKSLFESAVKAAANGVMHIIEAIMKAIWFYIEALVSGIASILNSIFR